MKLIKFQQVVGRGTQGFTEGFYIPEKELLIERDLGDGIFHGEPYRLMNNSDTLKELKNFFVEGKISLRSHNEYWKMNGINKVEVGYVWSEISCDDSEIEEIINLFESNKNLKIKLESKLDDINSKCGEYKEGKADIVEVEYHDI